VLASGLSGSGAVLELTDGSEYVEQFQFEYGGIVSRCVAVSASASGTYSLLEALMEVRTVRVRHVHVRP
jgi:hypothetical protein